MSDVIIRGARPLYGEIIPSGSKNAALPILFATIATRGISRIYNLPDIGDVRVAMEILKMLGAKIAYVGDAMLIDTECLNYVKIPRELTSKIRASSYLIGACLARFGCFHLSDFGGCNFCNRPIDMHLAAARAIGAETDDEKITSTRLSGGRIHFRVPSVGATVNALVMASAAEGDTVIEGGATEPHVRAVAGFLISAGAKIEFSDKEIYVSPGELHGAEITVIPDMIEAGTYLLAAPMTGGRISILYPYPYELESFLDPLSSSGVGVSICNGKITAYGAAEREIEITTAPYPGYPTDLQPQMAPLMAKFCGGVIRERVWQSRFSYLDALSPFGVRYTLNGSDARIYSSRLSAADTSSPDLRGGAAALLTALCTDGESKINNTETIDRGYSNIWKRLAALGADINKI